MKYLAAYLLLVQGGNAAPSAADIKRIIETVGVEADDSRIQALLTSLEGKGSLDEVIAAGEKKLATVPAAGAAGGVAAAAGGEAEEAKEEAKEEVKEESDDDMGFGLFD